MLSGPEAIAKFNRQKVDCTMFLGKNGKTKIWKNDKLAKKVLFRFVERND